MDKGMGQMRRITITLAVVAAILAAYGIGRYHSQSEAGGKTGRHALYYVDPMHPAYRSDKPGIAPDCGMKLEPVFAEDAGNAPPSSAVAQLAAGAVKDRNSTRLNSSHLGISYAVFC